MVSIKKLKTVLAEEVATVEKIIDERLVRGQTNFDIDLAGMALGLEPTALNALKILADSYVGLGGWAKVEVERSTYSHWTIRFKFHRQVFTTNDLLPQHLIPSPKD